MHVRLGKIDGELIMPKAVIAPGSHFIRGDSYMPRHE